MKAAIIFPHQLFKQNTFLHKVNRIYLVFEELYFHQFKFHKSKIAYHYAASNFYIDFLSEQGFSIELIETKNIEEFREFFNQMKITGINEICYYDTVDYLLERRIKRYCTQFSIHAEIFNSPSFLLGNNDIENIISDNSRFYQTDFYIKLRKKFGILIAGNSPVGNKWSFDTENRKKIPTGLNIPKPIHFVDNTIRIDAVRITEEKYKNNYGMCDISHYPVSYNEADTALVKFIQLKLVNFGQYQDAISKNEIFLFHSVISPAINTGLITPDEIISRIMDAFYTEKYPINSVEGFLRQIIGWREFIRAVYAKKGNYERTHNFFGFTNKLPVSFWEGTTGIEPLDDSIKKLMKYGYLHHIERLMIVGNFMLLCEISPDDVYRWFMELFIDAYDWVMVPNVYGMSQYADGGLITTKPYISGSNYIIKMSDYKKSDWSETWDALYWRFLFVHQDKFIKNPRMTMMLSILNKMEKSKLQSLINIADNFLKNNLQK